jgi:hypothetical protein
MEEILEKLEQTKELDDGENFEWKNWSAKEKIQLLNIYKKIAENENKLSNLIEGLNKSNDNWKEISPQNHGMIFDNITWSIDMAINKINEEEEEDKTQ